MTTISKIRFEHDVNGKSPHQISQELGISWATAKSYIKKSESEIKNMGKRPNRKPLIGNDEVKEAIRAHLMTEEKLKIHKKQRLTAVSLCSKLKAEGKFTGHPRYFRKIFKGIKESIQKVPKEKAYLELNFPLGQYLQIDHGPLEVQLKGEKFVRNGYVFCASIPQHSIRYCQVYLKKDSVSWGDFHERMFRFFGGVFPFCIYDNDSVLKIASTGRKSSLVLELEEYYGFESIYCNKASGWEKGSVENAVGTCRRNFLHGRPDIDELEKFNKVLEERVRKQINESNHYKTKKPLKEYLEMLDLKPLPEKFEWGVWKELRVDSYQRIRFQNNYYSLPEKFVGAKVKVYITSYLIKIYYDGDLISTHDRSFKEGEDSLRLDDYLNQLEQKPKAIVFSKVVQNAAKSFPDYLLELQEKLRNRMERHIADLEFVKILKLKNKCSSIDFETGIRLALSYGGVTSMAVQSFITQLQTKQLTQKEIKNLSPDCQINIKKDFDPSLYTCLCRGGLQ